MLGFSSIEEKVVFKKLMSKRLSKQDDTSTDSEINIKTVNEINIKLVNEINIKLEKLKAIEENYAFRKISSHRPIIGWGIVFIKRVIRKLLKWYIEPICFQQTEFNKISRDVENDICILLTSYEENRQIDKNEFILMKQQLEVYKRKIDELEKMIDSSKK